MSTGFNRVQLLGNLGADPELRMTSGGRAVLQLRLATTESYLDANRVKQERTEWHNVSIWGKRGEGLARVLSKGSRLMVDGSIRYSSYEGRDDGIKRWRTDIIAREIVLLGGGERRGQSDAYEPSGGNVGGDYEGPGADDDIPF